MLFTHTFASKMAVFQCYNKPELLTVLSWFPKLEMLDILLATFLTCAEH